MKLIWLRKAESDFNGVFEYILEQNPTAAWQTYQKIRTKIELLLDRPGIGRPGRVPGTRELVVTGTPYLVAYTVYRQLDAVVILRVLHGAREWPEEL